LYKDVIKTEGTLEDVVELFMKRF